MKLNINEVLFGLSASLDAVEGEILGATSYHAQRVAYISSLMGRQLGLSDYERLCLAVAAAMHDNALTEFASGEGLRALNYGDVDIESNLGKHCVLGENNVKNTTIYKDIEGAILYHHERADGTGPFKKRSEDTPIFARIIHLADRVDVRLDLSNIDDEKFKKVTEYVNNHIGDYFDNEVSKAFLDGVRISDIREIEGNKVVAKLYEEVPTYEKEYNQEDLLSISKMFAKIIDFKSPFTTRHSKGIAEKAGMMGEYYGWDAFTNSCLYFAGAVHDVGKLYVDNDLLEKPGKLTPDEFAKIKDHATGTYVVLSAIRGLETITSWAALHHEKLDGTGYPFGKTGDELDEKERLMACIDIYQALVEHRPYKEGMSHEKTMGILYSMAEEGKIDRRITADIDKVFKDWVEPQP